MPENVAAFQGSIPEFYDRHLGPVLFEAYAEDLAARMAAPENSHVVELACGTGIVTRQLLRTLPVHARFTATDLNPDKRAAAAQARRVLKRGGTYHFSTWGTLADNPFAKVAHETIAGFFPENPPQFYMTPFGYHDEALIRADLDAAGFSGVKVETVDKPATSVSADDFAIGLVRGNPVVADIRSRGTADVGTVEAAVAAAIGRMGGSSPFRSSLRALVVTAVA